MNGEGQGKGRSRWLPWAGVVLGAIVILAAAFVGGHLLGRRPLISSFRVRVVPAPELPDRPPDASGLVKEVKGHLIVLEIPGPGGGVVYIGPEGTRKEGEWRELQVVVTQDTKIYRCVFHGPQGMAQGGTVQEEAEEITLSRIKPGDSIDVWGRKEGDRIVAEVVALRRG